MTTDRYSGPGTWAALRASGDKMLVDTEGPGEVLVVPEPRSAFEVMQDPEAQIERARQTSRPARYISFLHLEASGGNAVNIVVTAGSFSATGHNAFWSGTYCAVDEKDRVRLVELSRVWSD